MLLVKSKGFLHFDKFVDFNDIPEPFDFMEFQIGEHKFIGLSGFEKYIRIKEMYRGVNCNIKGISKVLLFGQSKNQVAVVTINLRNGKISQKIKEKGQEYNSRPLNKELWKKGIPDKEPKIYIREEV